MKGPVFSKILDTKAVRVVTKVIAVGATAFALLLPYSCENKDQKLANQAAERQSNRFNELSANVKMLDGSKAVALDLKYQLDHLKQTVKDARSEVSNLSDDPQLADTSCPALDRLAAELRSFERLLKTKDSLAMISKMDSTIVQSTVDSLRLYSSVDYGQWVQIQNRRLHSIRRDLAAIGNLWAANLEAIVSPDSQSAVSKTRSMRAVRAILRRNAKMDRIVVNLGEKLVRMSDEFEGMFGPRLSVVDELRMLGSDLRAHPESADVSLDLEGGAHLFRNPEQILSKVETTLNY